MSPADTSHPCVCPRLAEGSWKAPHTPFKRSWTPLLTPITDRWGGRGGGRGGRAIHTISDYDVITVASKVLLRHPYTRRWCVDGRLFFTDFMRVHTRARNINMLIRYKCRYLVLKPLTRHYTLIPIFDPYRFLMSNQYRGAGSAIPKSIGVHGGGGSSLFGAPGAEAGRCEDRSLLVVVRALSFCLHRGHRGHRRTRAGMRSRSGARP